MINDSERERFSEICKNVSDVHVRNSIGTYKEKSVHLALKQFFESNPDNTEVKVGGFVADIRNGTGIHEIQTSGFGKMRNKLEAFLSEEAVEIIYPVITSRNVRWVSPDTGEIEKEYKSPKHDVPAVIFKELLYLGEHLYSPSLTITVVTLEADETRLLDGYGADKRRRATKYDIVPTKLCDVMMFTSPYELGALLPYADGDVVYIKELKKYMKLGGRNGSAAIKVLENIGIIEKDGKDGRLVRYKVHKNERQ